MRQAGRYLPEYMAVRSRVTFLELCTKPELAAEVTLTAQRVLGVDAAILFSDLLPILQTMGLDLEYAKGEGPVIHNSLKAVADLERFRELEDPGELGYVYDAIRIIRRELPADIPLLGFAGAPFTLASYAIEGGGSKSYEATKRFMYEHPADWDKLMMRLVRSVSKFLNAQIAAGCQAVQVFDSWVGCLSPRDYERYVLPYSRWLLSSLTPGTPVIHFLTGNSALLELQRASGGSVQGVDWRTELGSAWDRFGDDVAVQGNLDPVVLLADWDTVRQQTDAVLAGTRGRPGHIFNLGHGVLPPTNPDQVRRLVDYVHEQTSSSVG